MTDEHDVSPANDEPDPSTKEPSNSRHEPGTKNIQSLTDFFDQMDRAAFKRALAHRDAVRDTVVPAKFQRR